MRFYGGRRPSDLSHCGRMWSCDVAEGIDGLCHIAEAEGGLCNVTKAEGDLAIDSVL